MVLLAVYEHQPDMICCATKFSPSNNPCSGCVVTSQCMSTSWTFFCRPLEPSFAAPLSPGCFNKSFQLHSKSNNAITLPAPAIVHRLCCHTLLQLPCTLYLPCSILILFVPGADHLTLATRHEHEHDALLCLPLQLPQMQAPGMWTHTHCVDMKPTLSPACLCSPPAQLF